MIIFRDFIPELLAIKPSRTFETIPKVIERINSWLLYSPNYKVKYCETFQIKTDKKNENNSETMSYERAQNGDPEGCWTYNKYLICIRVWMEEGSHSELQVVNLRTYKPRPLDDKGNVFEDLDVFVGTTNKDLQTNPLEGKILCIETKPIQFSFVKNFDVDLSYWKENGTQYQKMVFVMRIFYFVGEPKYENISIFDYEPTLPMIKDKPDYTKIKTTKPFIDQFDKFQRSNPGAFGRFCNFQTVDIKIKLKMFPFESNRQILRYTELCTACTYYRRILRVFYVNSINSREIAPQNPVMSYKTFQPVLLTTSLAYKKFETLSETFTRIKVWLNIVKLQSDVDIAYIETIPMRYESGGEKYHGLDAGYTINKCGGYIFWIYAIRIYFYGTFSEPNPSLLPVVPPVLKTSCCSLT